MIIWKELIWEVLIEALWGGKIGGYSYYSKFVGSEIRKARVSSQGNSPFYTTAKPDIPLREPLEEEGRKKRKMAKDILEKGRCLGTLIRAISN